MANDVRVNIEVRKEQEAKAKLKAVGDQAEKTGDQIEELGDQASAAGKATEKAGDGFKASADDAGFLDKQIIQTTAHLKELVTQLDRTGDTSLLKDIRKERRNLRQFQGLAKEIAEPVAEAGVAAGVGLAKSLAEGFRTGSAALKGAAVPVFAGLAVAAAPGIGAAISAAVLGGVGTGGIIGGIALASRDSRVKALASQVGDTLLDEFSDAASSFVDPVLKSLDKVGSAKWADKLAPGFDKLASKVEPLTNGLIGLVDNALPGLNEAIEAAGPLLDTIARELPEVGSALNNFFNDIAENPEAAALFMERLFDSIEETLDIAGGVIEFLADLYDASAKIEGALGIGENRMRGWRKETEGAAGSTRNYADAAGEAERAVDQLGREIDEYLGKTFSLEEMQDRAAEGFADLAEQIKRQREEGDAGAGSLEGQTEAARANREAMRGLVGIYGDMISKAITTGQSTEGLRAEFVKAATQAGLNKKQVERYADELERLIRLQRQFVGGIDSGGMGGAVFSQRASGGPVNAGQTYLVGEEGPELVTFGANGMVHNAQQTKAMMSGASGGSAMGVATGGSMQLLVSVKPGTDAVMNAIINSLQFEVRTTANGSAQEFFGTTTGG